MSETTLAPPTETTPEATMEVPLKIADRCDKRGCGAQAFVRAVYKDGDLLFCNHDYRELKAEIEAKALAVFDYSDQINAKPSISANAE